jgi:hypothetical protein
MVSATTKLRRCCHSAKVLKVRHGLLGAWGEVAVHPPGAALPAQDASLEVRYRGWIDVAHRRPGARDWASVMAGRKREQNGKL